MYNLSEEEIENFLNGGNREYRAKYIKSIEFVVEEIEDCTIILKNKLYQNEKHRFSMAEYIRGMTFGLQERIHRIKGNYYMLEELRKLDSKIHSESFRRGRFFGNCEIWEDLI